MEYESLEDVMEQVREGAGSRAVFGEPIRAEGRTVVPVARVAFGFGGGGGVNDEDDEQSEGFGGAVGYLLGRR
jgi:uncharacterized spore protein YtfJ